MQYEVGQSGCLGSRDKFEGDASDRRGSTILAFFWLPIVLIGLLLGSFANVVVYRLPRGESVVRPRSHCLNCFRELSAFENIPLLSWIVQKGRCRGCGTRISARYPATELLVAGAFSYSFWMVGVHWSLFYVLIGDLVAIVASEIDLGVHRIPNILLIWGLAVCLALIAMQVFIGHKDHGIGKFFIAMVVSSGALYIIALISGGGMGMGDVKLVGLLGAISGLLGYGSVFMMLLSAFAIGSIFGIALILLKKAHRKSTVPFGPFIGAGFLVSQASYHFAPHLFGL